MRNKVVAAGIGAPLAKREIVLLRAAFIAVAGDPDADLRILPQPVRLSVQRGLRLRRQAAPVGIKEDTVAGRLDQILLAAGRAMAGRIGSGSRRADVAARASCTTGAGPGARRRVLGRTGGQQGEFLRGRSGSRFSSRISYRRKGRSADWRPRSGRRRRTLGCPRAARIGVTGNLGRLASPHPATDATPAARFLEHYKELINDGPMPHAAVQKRPCAQWPSRLHVAAQQCGP